MQPHKKKDFYKSMSNTNPQNKPNNPQKPFKPKFNFYWIYLAIALFFIASYFLNDNSQMSREVPISKFQNVLADNCTKKITIDKTAGSIEAEVDTACAATLFEKKIDYKGQKTVRIKANFGSIAEMEKQLADLRTRGIYTGEVTYKEGRNYLSFILWNIVPFLFIIGLFFFLNRRMGGAGGGIFSVGKSKAQLFDKKNGIKITFKDVAGLEGAKEEVQEIVSFLKNPKKYTELGGKIPKGALLVGPPGTGKTLLAKAVAGEAEVPFFSLAGSDFVEMFVGVGASRVRDLFQRAKASAPCIIFIDEIDAVGRARGRNPNMNVNDERENTLNQLLTEMDGFEGNSGVIILAATNRPESLDPALLRPGRFDRRIPVELPDLKGREEILKVHAKKVRLADNVNFHTIARMASGASGAELANIINEAALRAVRSGRKVANQQDLEESVETVIAGYQKKNAVLTDKEKATVAYHEIGHALVAALQNHSAPVQKITIIPRTSGALGYTLQVEEHDKYLYSKEDLLNKICTYTAGRAAEEVEFGVITTGASNDIEQATKIARALITQYGMDEQFGMVQLSQRNSRYLGDESTSTCSEKTLEEIDKRVVALVQEQHDKAVALLRENKDKLNELAQFLYEKETITGEQFMDILNRPSAYASLGQPQPGGENMQ